MVINQVTKLFQYRYAYLNVNERLAVKQLKSGVVYDRQKVDEAQLTRKIQRVDEVTTETEVDIERQRGVGLGWRVGEIGELTRQFEYRQNECQNREIAVAYASNRLQDR